MGFVFFSSRGGERSGNGAKKKSQKKKKAGFGFFFPSGGEKLGNGGKKKKKKVKKEVLGLSPRRGGRKIKLKPPQNHKISQKKEVLGFFFPPSRGRGSQRRGGGEDFPFSGFFRPKRSARGGRRAARPPAEAVCPFSAAFSPVSAFFWVFFWGGGRKTLPRAGPGNGAGPHKLIHYHKLSAGGGVARRKRIKSN